jgi:hypothetical protein
MNPDDRQALYDAPYPENTNYVGPGGSGTSFRTYFCRCNAANLAGVESVDLTDYGWVCGGHPQQT